MTGSGADLVVLAGFLCVIPEKMVKAYENRIINIHPSLIPSFCGDGYYGLKVHEAALSRGVKVTGATVHYVDEGTDIDECLDKIKEKYGDKPISEVIEMLLCQCIDSLSKES